MISFQLLLMDAFFCLTSLYWIPFKSILNDWETWPVNTHLIICFSTSMFWGWSGSLVLGELLASSARYFHFVSYCSLPSGLCVNGQTPKSKSKLKPKNINNNDSINNTKNSNKNKNKNNNTNRNNAKNSNDNDNINNPLRAWFGCSHGENSF